MNLTIAERLMMGQLFPQKGNLMTQILMEDITKKVTPTQSELTQIEFKVHTLPNGETTYVWNPDKAIDMEVEFTKAEIEFLQIRVNELDKHAEITAQMLSLCKKIREIY
jgi:hypothetical protein